MSLEKYLDDIRIKFIGFNKVDYEKLLSEGSINNDCMMVFDLEQDDKFQFDNDENNIYSLISKQIIISNQRTIFQKQKKVFAYCHIKYINVTKPDKILKRKCTLDTVVDLVNLKKCANCIKYVDKKLSQNMIEYVEEVTKIKEYIKNIQQLVVMDSQKEGSYYMYLYKKYSTKIYDDNLVFKNCFIDVSDKYIPPKYTTILIKELNVGDIIELTFQNRSKICKRYRGKTIRFIVNNKYESSPTYVLIPQFDEWSIEDVIILEDCSESFNMSTVCSNISVTNIDVVGKIYNSYPRSRNEVEIEQYQNLTSLTEREVIDSKHFYLEYNRYDKNLQILHKPILINVIPSSQDIKSGVINGYYDYKTSASSNSVLYKIITLKDVEIALQFLRNKIRKLDDKLFNNGRSDLYEDITQITFYLKMNKGGGLLI